MRNLKLIFPVFIVFIFSGCISLPKNLNTTFEAENNNNFESLVDKAEQSMKKCFDKPDGDLLYGQTTVIREDYYHPRYSKIKVIYPTTIGHWSHSYLNVLYLIQKEHGNQIILKELNLVGVRNVKKLVSNNMECK